MYYSEAINKAMNDDQHLGAIDNAENVVSFQVATEDQRKVIKMYIQVNNQHIIEKAQAQVHGCGFTIAAAAKAAELICGKKVMDALQVTSDEIIDALDLSEEKAYCAILAEDSIQGVIQSYQEKKL